MLGAIPCKWAAATVVQPVAPWTQTINSNAPTTLALAISNNVPMVRASLVKNDFLMKSLGRPLREQIVSMRPSGLSTLEAIDLSNGQTFATALARGGQTLAGQDWTNRTELIDHIFQFALSRQPTPDELQTVESFVSIQPNAQEIEDLLWAILIMPEFMLVR